MKLGDIKIEALKIMFANVDTDLNINGLTQYKTMQAYKEYLAGMPGSINRCFSDIENKQVLPEKAVTLTYNDGTDTSNGYIEYNLPSDCFTVNRVAYIGNGYQNSVGYIVNVDKILLPKIDEGESYTLIYLPRLTRIDSTTAETTELAIPDYIATAIPYYIKGDLFRVDEPNEASESRNWYETALASIRPMNLNGQTNVDSVYSIGD